MSEELGDAARIGGQCVLTGSCSWTDATLVRDSGWYPRKTMSAEERLGSYAVQFPLAEIDSNDDSPPLERAGSPVRRTHPREVPASM
ncbi:MAG TPA: hypothetical protein VFP55_09205 [Solirubrobacteraceae bacterium]|nr:hypothetical protein [Solirubrobacteraceae bacterium]